MHFLVAEHTLADVHIAVHDGRRVVDGLDEIAVDALIDILAQKRFLQAAFIAADVLVEDILLDASVVGRGKRSEDLAVCGVEEPERFLALGAVLPAHDHGVKPVRDRLLLALVFDLGRVEFGIVEQPEHVVCNGHGLGRLCKDALLRLGKDVLFFCDQTGEHIVVVLEALIGRKGTERLFGERGEFGRHKGSLHRKLRQNAHHLAHIAHVLGVADVLVVL